MSGLMETTTATAVLTSAALALRGETLTSADPFVTSENIFTDVPGAIIEYGATPGCFHLDMASADYHSLPDSVSCSGLKHLLRSPAHYQAYLNSPFDDKPNIGTALHCAVLEPDVFEKTYTYYSGDRRGKTFGAFVENNPGKIVLSEKEWICVQRMVKAIMTFDEYPLWEALRAARREMSVFWTDEETGVQCRVRFDAICSPFAILDLKTTTDARPDQFIKQAVRLDYDLQAAMYTEAARRFTGELLEFNFIAVEEEDPNGIWLMPAGQSMLDNGWRKFRKALELYKRCTETGCWPKYTNARTTLEMPRHALIKD
jgi:hypothetical protein